MKRQFIELMALFIVGGLGGTAHYIHHWMKGRKFSWGIFLSNIGLAGFVGIVIGSIIPDASNIHDAAVAIGGFLSTQVLDMLDKKGAIIIDSLIKVRIEETKMVGGAQEAIVKVENAEGSKNTLNDKN